MACPAPERVRRGPGGGPALRHRAASWAARPASSPAAKPSAPAWPGPSPCEPEILFLDEPFSALDPPTREALLDDLGAALRQTRTTAVLATHDQLEALRLADLLAVHAPGPDRPERPRGRGGQPAGE